jgi:hypothetical protein
LIFGKFNLNKNVNYYNYQKKVNQEQLFNNLLVHKCKILLVVKIFFNKNFVKQLLQSIKNKSNHLMEINFTSKNFVKLILFSFPILFDKLSMKLSNNIKII